MDRSVESVCCSFYTIELDMFCIVLLKVLSHMGFHLHAGTSVARRRHMRLQTGGEQLVALVWIGLLWVPTGSLSLLPDANTLAVLQTDSTVDMWVSAHCVGLW